MDVIMTCIYVCCKVRRPLAAVVIITVTTEAVRDCRTHEKAQCFRNIYAQTLLCCNPHT